jgi:hypothetical protein
LEIFVNTRRPVLVVLAAAAAISGMSILACIGNPLPDGGDCPAENPAAAVNAVAGTYRYSGDNLFLLRGTITFEQQNNMVRVTDTTYENSSDRRLRSEFTALQGNKLVAVLTPINGDTDYRADVTFLFSEDGRRFCVAFSDTNGDTGDMGTYVGFKQ